ncbi:hypothetical protein HWV62_3210 [Athelia sp. TMB]|nr:hypothetical protein HWV62_3210 [Athelia sp. TMB]
MVAQIASLVLASVLYATATSAAAAASDNGACAQMKTICQKAVDEDVTNPWSIEACVYGASCYAGSDPVDTFLKHVYEGKNHDYTCFEGYPTSKLAPRVSSKVLDAISTDKKIITQQNFIDGFYNTLDSTKGPYPSSTSVVASYYDRLTSWTSYCNGNIPVSNFADYFQYSSTVNSVYCASSKRDVAAIPTISKDETCQAMFVNCIHDVDVNYFAHASCVLGATCIDGKKPVADFLTAVATQLPGNNTHPTALTQQRLTQTLFNQWSTDNKTLTEQNFIDAWYSELQSVGGPYPDSTDLVVEYFDRIAAWAGYCDEGVPYDNTADYYQYSSTVDGAESS